MRILLINPPYQTLTSNRGVGHQVPLGLLMVGGPLIDAGHEVSLLDAEARRLSIRHIVKHVGVVQPKVVMTGHAGSTPAHPVCMRMLEAIRSALPHIMTVYGGVFPTYHARPILESSNAVDVIVRGEGEATAVDVVESISRQGLDANALAHVKGIAFRPRCAMRAIFTPDRPPIANLDEHRVGWELIGDWDRYTCFGLGRSAIIQFSRGCPHRCTYCGQHGFWVKWRHRDPVALADEIARLHDEHGIRFLTLADENPTTSPREWRRFLEEMATRNAGWASARGSKRGRAEAGDGNCGGGVQFFATIRADDIVRDSGMLDLYRAAGILYVLLGIDTTDPHTVEMVRKRSTAAKDRHACTLLRAHGIRSIIGHIVGLGSERWSDLMRALRILMAYDGDLLNAMYATPHTWTVFARENADRAVVEHDQSRWDYRHQVLETEHLKPWQLFLAVKWMEMRYHLRPRRVWRMVWDADPAMRRQLRWTALHTGAVWLGEIVEFALRSIQLKAAPPARALRTWIDQADVPVDTARLQRNSLVPLTVHAAEETAAPHSGQA